MEQLTALDDPKLLAPILLTSCEHMGQNQPATDNNATFATQESGVVLPEVAVLEWLSTKPDVKLGKGSSDLSSLQCYLYHFARRVLVSLPRVWQSFDVTSGHGSLARTSGSRDLFSRVPCSHEASMFSGHLAISTLQCPPRCLTLQCPYTLLCLSSSHSLAATQHKG